MTNVISHGVVLAALGIEASPSFRCIPSFGAFDADTCSMDDWDGLAPLVCLAWRLAATYWQWCSCAGL